MLYSSLDIFQSQGVTLHWLVLCMMVQLYRRLVEQSLHSTVQTILSYQEQVLCIVMGRHGVTLLLSARVISNNLGLSWAKLKLS